MKILHIIDGLGLGGAQTVVKGIFEAQQDNKDIYLFALRERNITTNVDHKNVYIFNSKRKYILSPIFALKKIIIKEKIEILHCHLFRSNVIGYLLKIFWFSKAKLVIHEHGGVAEDGLFYRLYIKISQNKVNCYIAVSKYIQEKLHNAGAQTHKINLLYNFVDASKFNPKQIDWDVSKERERLGLQEGAFVIGFAGRLIRRKGWREFIQAAMKITSKYKKTQFLIAGDGPEKKEVFKMIIDSNLQLNIIFIGRIQNMMWFYTLLDCFVVPSHWEPMGLTHLEAMTAGIPVICANVAALNEVVQNGENGLLFQANDSNDLEEKIKLVYQTQELREKLICNGIESVKMFNLENYLKKLRKFYE